MSTLATWARDLRLGARFALAGGRSGWVRTALTALGTALGVTVLLLAASLPNALTAGEQREDARWPVCFDDFVTCEETEPGPDTVLFRQETTFYGDDQISGMTVSPDAGAGTTAPPPPGLDAYPGPGEMVVSPALGRLLDSPEGELLAERLDYERAGVIGDEGLRGPMELYFYLGSDDLSLDESGTFRTQGFGGALNDEGEVRPELLLLALVACVVLLAPVLVFLAAAARVGGERRDRRLAALRLVGADIATARRIAAGETLAGTLLGLALGAGGYLLLRQAANSVTIGSYSAYPSDVTPSLPLAVLIFVAVPVLAVAVTLVALRGVAIQPLGVVRAAGDRRRRLTWRLVPGAVGLLLIGHIASQGGEAVRQRLGQVETVAGILLLLVAVTILLPWLVERVVGSLGGGPVSWQLAARRLQLSSGSAARAVSGITIAVAGATALYMVFAGVRTVETADAVADGGFQAKVSVYDDAATARQEAAQFTAAPGVTDAITLVNGYGELDGDYVSVVVGDCDALRALARTGDCADGDVFLSGAVAASPGGQIRFTDGDGSTWTVPEGARSVESQPTDAGTWYGNSVLATPGTLDPARFGDGAETAAYLVTDPAQPHTLEQLRTLEWDSERDVTVSTVGSDGTSSQFRTLSSALVVGACGIMALMGASLLLSLVEQLRERKRQLAVLVAYGTPRSALGLSVLWQTAIPVVLGLVLASAVGTALGAVLTNLVNVPVDDWFSFLPMAGAGVAVIAAMTLASMPLLWRLTRPDGLRTE